MNMKQHTTNYQNTFIEVAEDSLISESKIPPEKKEKTMANLQYEIILKNPYKYTSDDIIFECYSIKNAITKREKPAERQKFFSKGQPCLRCSPLAKTYGFGIHHNNEGKVALYPLGSEDYQKFLKDDTVTKVKAMRSKRK